MKRFLVTAGNTREAIDRVRDWGNIFTGNTGRAIAQELAKFGIVELITSNQQHAAELAASSIQTTLFRDHASLRAILEQRTSTATYDAVFMTAAIADYKPRDVFRVIDRIPTADGTETWKVQNVSAGKVKSSFDTVAVLGERTEKLVDLFRSKWSYRGLLVKFKLEVGISEDQLVQIAEKSRRDSDADYIVANTLEMVGGDNAGAWLIGDSIRERVPREALPGRLALLVQERELTGD